MLCVFIYIILGAIISLIDWICLVDKETKENNNICIYLVTGTVFWPFIIVANILILIIHINKRYFK